MKSLLIYVLLFAICFEFIFAIDQQPRSRKKRILGTGKVYRMGQGLGTGPVGPENRVEELKKVSSELKKKN